MPSKHKTIAGLKCEADLLVLGEKLARNAPLGIQGALSIWEDALDGNKVTEAERNAIRHIMRTAPHGLTSEAKAFFQYWLNEKTASEMKGGDKIIVDGVKVDEAMMNVAEHYKKNRRLGIRAAEGIWFSALDGKGVTNMEKATIDLILKKFNFDDAGKKFLESKQTWLTVAADAIAVDEAGGKPGALLALANPDAVLLSRTDAIALELVPLPPPAARPAARVASNASAHPGAGSPSPSGSDDHHLIRAIPVFAPGTNIRVHRLNAASLNGLSGTCEEFDEGKDRWIVRLANGEVKSLKPQNLMGPGRTVRLQGLTNAAFNDLQGTVEEFDDSTQRWSVRLLNGDVKNLKSDNLEIDASAEKRGSEESPEPPAKRARQGPKMKLDKLRDIFDRCDINKDGVVNKRELIKACRQNSGVAEFFEVPTDIRQEEGKNQLEVIFQEIDRDDDREIRWAELLAYYRHRVLDLQTMIQ